MRTDSILRKEDKAATALMWIAPSLTTFMNLVPSYRVFLALKESHDLVDYHQYRLNDLEKYNQLRQNASFAFDKQYSFLEEYDLPDLSPSSVLARFGSIMDHQEYLLKYM